jgi:hypothetical protein
MPKEMEKFDASFVVEDPHSVTLRWKIPIKDLNRIASFWPRSSFTLSSREIVQELRQSFKESKDENEREVLKRILDRVGSLSYLAR